MIYTLETCDKNKKMNDDPCTMKDKPYMCINLYMSMLLRILRELDYKVSK